VNHWISSLALLGGPGEHNRVTPSCDDGRMKVIAFESVWDRDVSELDGQGLADRLQKLEQERGLVEAELAR
jgi:hypothetical protein